VQPYCPRCATPLSNFEVNEGYREVTGPSITVTFPLADDPCVKFLVWTTTPWTLPSNVALAVGPDITYVKVRDGSDCFILAKDRLGAYYKSPEDYEIIEEMPGSALEGSVYTPLFDFFTDRSDAFFRVTTADFVSTEDGTGIVHIAPAFGEDDFLVGRRLELPIVCPVDEEGKFTEEVGPWHGKLVYEADREITAAIKQEGRLVHRGTVKHRYPFCYRCDTALIYKAITTWFMRIDPLKANMLDNNRRIHWVPEHLRDGRFGKGVESAPDWNISRNRYWGTPLPVWICACGRQECVGSLEQLHTLVGGGNAEEGRRIHAETAKKVSDRLRTRSRAILEQNGIDLSWAERLEQADISPVDLHRHVIDELPVTCPACGGTDMARTSEVLDCWFESGSMPYAQSHYPFEQPDVFEHSFPADFIAEGLDQTRGWFYTLTVLASALFGKEAFKNVVVNGIILSEDGKKLSKRLRNYTPPEEILDKLGADSLRLFLINSPAVKAEDLRFSERGVTEMSRAVLLPFWNAYSFFVTYANVDKWQPSGDAPESGNELDRWIISLLNHTISQVNTEMEGYNLYRVVPLLVDFIDNLTNWYIRRSRRRFWKSENDADKGSAYGTLYHVLVEFARVMSPFLPFLTEAIYRNLVVGRCEGAPDSVHLCPYPTADEARMMPELETKMRLVRQTVTMGRALRSRYSIKTRQPLAEMTVVIRNAERRELVADMASLIAEELNVKNVLFSDNEDSVVSISAKPNYRRLGRVYGPEMKEAAKEIEALSPAEIRTLEAGESRPIREHTVGFDDIEIRRERREGVEVETEGEITVALSTEVTEELRAEGYARELVNRIQNLRKKRELDVTDRIVVSCACDDELRGALRAHLDYIRSETLAEEVVWREGEEAESVDINGLPARIQIERLG
jgi:isoleucyl-tRNA synthetase